MNSTTLIFRIVAILAVCGAAVQFFIAKSKIEERDAKISAAVTAHEQTKAELTTANTEISTLNTKLIEGRKALGDSKREIESVRSEMYMAKQEVSRTKAQLNQAKDDLNELEADLKDTRSKLVNAERAVIAADKTVEVAALKKRIKELESANMDLDDELNFLKSKAEALAKAREEKSSGSISVNGYTINQGGAAVQPATIGEDVTIASISREDGLIVFNNSAALNLAPGATVTVIQDMKALGKVQVSQVKPAYTVANILPGTNAWSIDSGSTVKILR
jgi:uncharacterized Zn ribbon protein/archaellum component FlaC